MSFHWGGFDKKLHNRTSGSEKKIWKVSVQEGMIYKIMVFLKYFTTEFDKGKVAVISFLMSVHPRLQSYRWYISNPDFAK